MLRRTQPLTPTLSPPPRKGEGVSRRRGPSRARTPARVRFTHDSARPSSRRDAGATRSFLGAVPEVAAKLKEAHTKEIKLGVGPAVTHGLCNHPGAIERLEQVAAQLKIPLQHEAASATSGTDTEPIFWTRGGIASGLISLPNRYMHSPLEMVNLRDLEPTSAQCLDGWSCRKPIRAMGNNSRMDKLIPDQILLQPTKNSELRSPLCGRV
ncbi:MAG: hypothetical protein EXS27_09755 [Pedosphaera sp.]|nr:hypothetical protein [Pedosphaera sp.]